METKNMIGGIVSLAVVVICVAAIMMPVLSDATTVYTTFDNEGYFTYDEVTEDTDVTLTYDPADTTSITVNGTEITMPTGNGNWTICGSENFTLRFTRTDSGAKLQCYGDGGYLAGDPESADVQSATVDDASMVFSRNTSTSKTYTMGTHGFVINPEGTGDLTLKYSDESAYIHGDSEVYLCGTTFVTGSGTNDYVGIFGYGTYDDLTLSTFYGVDTYPATFGDVTATVEEVSAYKDLYLLEKFTFPLTQNSATVTATYSYFVVPSEITAEKAVHFTDGENALLAAIPVLVIVSLVIAALGIAITSRRD